MEKGTRNTGNYDNQSRKQREKNEAQRIQRQKAKRNRLVVGAVGGVVLLGAAVGLTFAATNQEQHGNTVDSHISTQSTPDTSLPLLPEVTQGDFTSRAGLAASEYTRLTGVSVDSQKFITNVVLAPNSTKMTPQETARFCGKGLDLKCHEAVAVTTDPGGEVFFYKDAFDETFRNARNSELVSNSRNEYILHIMFHELSHWRAKTYPVSDELYKLAIKYAGEKNAFINDPKYTKGAVNGALISGVDTVGGGSFEVFRGLDEAEAETIARYILTNRGVPVYTKFDGQNDTYVSSQRKLLVDLLNKIGPDYGTALKNLAQSRIEEGGREKLFKNVGEKFGADDASALDIGFKIFFAIDGGNSDAYRALTQVTTKP